MAPAFVLAKTSDYNRRSPSKFRQKLNRLSCVGTRHFSLVRIEELPSHGGVIQVLGPCAADQRGTGRKNRKPNVEVPVALPPMPGNAAPKNPAFLVPVKALSVLVRAKMCAALNRAGLLDQMPAAVWTTPWVVHAKPAGDGARVLDYLARYLFRVAISNSRLERIDDDQVTFRYRDNRTQEIRRATLSGVEFLCRFLQHVLPRRCTKVRYYGLWSPTRRSDLEQARRLLQPSPVPSPPMAASATPTPTPPPGAMPPCPLCRAGTLILVAVLRPLPRAPP